LAFSKENEIVARVCRHIVNWPSVSSSCPYRVSTSNHRCRWTRTLRWTKEDCGPYGEESCNPPQTTPWCWRHSILFNFNIIVGSCWKRPKIQSKHY